MKPHSIFLVALLLFSTHVCKAQKNDYIWMNGYASFGHTIDSSLGINVFDFNSTPVDIYIDSFDMSFSITNSSYCNDEGSLLFYTNGAFIENSYHRIIENSDSINAGYFMNYWRFDSSYGYGSALGLMILPSLRKDSQYYVIHSWIDTASPSDGYFACRQLRYSLVDMSANGGEGKVLDANHVLLSGLLANGVAAVKQGNGRDWWLVCKKLHSNCYEFFSLDSLYGLQFSHEDCLGDTFHAPTFHDNALIFTNDGGKLIYSNTEGGISILDFDRCDASLSNYVHIPFYTVPIGICSHSVTSPSGRFLYMLAYDSLFQFDLYAADIMSTKILISAYDTSMIYATFTLGQLAPDGKIYVTGSYAGTVTYWSVINEPDSLGIACNFGKGTIHTPCYNAGMPYYPNYRLGRLIGSPCDTLSNAINEQPTTKNEQLKLFPNPVCTELIIDYGFLEWSGLQNVQLQITNTLGQSVFEMIIPDYSAIQRLNVSKFASGIYKVNISSGGNIKMSGSFVKE